MTRNLLKWFGEHARDLPWRRTRDPYAIWISEVMLQQTQVKTVIPYWERWMKRLPNVRALARAPEQRVLKLWEGLGYYSRARNLQKAARIIVTDYAGEVPSHFENLIALPGIGRYTAGAICSIAFNQPEPVLDGNVVRVLTRLFAIGGDPKSRRTSTQLWDCARELVSIAGQIDRGTGCSHLNQSLMELGAMICEPQRPQCNECPVKTYCVARRHGQVERYPAAGRKPAVTPLRFAAFVLEREGRFLVRKREPGVVNGGLWEFPNVEVRGGLKLAELARKHLGLDMKKAKRISTIRHTITRYRITMDVFRSRAPEGRGSSDEVWRTIHELDKLPFPSAHRRILNALAQ